MNKNKIKIEINLNNTPIESWPKDLDQQTDKLIDINISNNNLIYIPEELLKNKNLYELYVSNNQLTTLPNNFEEWVNLEILDLSKNNITSIPSAISQIMSLRSLDLSKNKINTIPSEVSHLSNLLEINLSDNQLVEIPIELGLLPNLKDINLSNNPELKSPPPGIVSQGTRAIKTYFKDKLQATQNQWISKLLIVGQGGVGKTQLLRILSGEGFDPNFPSTHGVNVQSISLAHPSKAEVSMILNAWDFGGQEIYHATHQFFLTNRSLFLLIWNTIHGYEQGKLFYWLDAIQAKAPESPVIIVATHIDERSPDLPISEIKAKYPMVVRQCAVSNLTGEGIESLKEVIVHEAASLPLMGEQWPQSWLNASDDLRSSKEKYITPNKLNKILISHGVPEISVQVLSQWLHELGDILFFQEDEDLNNTVILKPQWVSEYISKIIDDDGVILRKGILTRTQMDNIWSNLDLSTRDHFLCLMEKFDLSYRTLEDREISLVVERLPLDPPIYQEVWDEILSEDTCQEIEIIYRLNTIPPGIPTWFIARSHRFTTHTHWRNGALLQYNRDKRQLALIRAYPHERYLQLIVRGENPHNFFSLLKDGIELVLERFPGLKIDRKIPCPGHKGKPCSQEFDYSQLINRLSKKPYIECPETLQEVDVRTLLFGLTPTTIDDVLVEINKSTEEIMKSNVYNKQRHNELVILLQREFMKSFRRAQSQIDSYCPNVFVLRPLSMEYVNNSLNNPKYIDWKRTILGTKVELKLYCQQPGSWHPTKRGGSYIINSPAEWLLELGPYLKNLMKVLKYTSLILGPLVGIADNAYKDLINNDIQIMQSLINIMPELIDQQDVDSAIKAKLIGDLDEPERTYGSALRALRLILDQVDPEQNWGGLSKVLTPEGHYLWLCETHAQEYQ